MEEIVTFSIEEIVTFRITKRQCGVESLINKDFLARQLKAGEGVFIPFHKEDEKRLKKRISELEKLGVVGIKWKRVTRKVPYMPDGISEQKDVFSGWALWTEQ